MRIKKEDADVGVIVARFHVQKLHSAHRKLIQSVVDEHQKVIIFLGLAPNIGTRCNPLDFESRKQMVLSEFPNVNVLYIKDVRDDNDWSQTLDRQIEDLIGPLSTVMLYGGRESFIDHYFGKFPTCELEQESYVSGQEIRKQISKRVKASEEFREGVIWSVYNRYPMSIPTVDVAIFNEDYDKLLLARKSGEKAYRFVGGFVNAERMEDAAIREVAEETHLEIGDLKILGTCVIDDWRYRRELDKIVTTFFVAKQVFGQPRPDDDICELKWFEYSKIKEQDLVEEHRPLLKMLNNYMSV